MKNQQKKWAVCLTDVLANKYWSAPVFFLWRTTPASDISLTSWMVQQLSVGVCVIELSCRFICAPEDYSYPGIRVQRRWHTSAKGKRFNFHFLFCQDLLISTQGGQEMGHSEVEVVRGKTAFCLEWPNSLRGVFLGGEGAGGTYCCRLATADEMVSTWERWGLQCELMLLLLELKMWYKSDRGA